MKGHLKRLKTFLLVTSGVGAGGYLLTSTGWRTGMQFNILHTQDSPHNKEYPS